MKKQYTNKHLCLYIDEDTIARINSVHDAIGIPISHIAKEGIKRQLDWLEKVIKCLQQEKQQ